MRNAIAIPRVVVVTPRRRRRGTDGRTDVQSIATFDPCDADRDGVERHAEMWKQTENARVI
jgi:hypothetical protein